MPMSPKLLRPRQTIHPEAADWANRVRANGGSVSGATLAHVDRFVKAVHAAGIRDRFFRVNLFCGDSDANLAAVRTPLFRGQSLGGAQFGGATDTNINFVVGDYAETGPSGGLKGNGSTKALNTEMAANTLTGGNRHLSVYENLKTTNTFDTSIGSDGAAGSSNTFALGTFTPASTYIFAFANDYSGLTSASYSGGAHWIGVNGSTGTGVLYKDGAHAASGSFTQGTPGSENIRVFALGRGTSSADPSNARLCSYSIGVAMSQAQAQAFYTAMQAFQAALRRNV